MSNVSTGDLFGGDLPNDQPSQFDAARPDHQKPLADRLRPRSLKDVLGQDHLLAADGPLGQMVETGAIVSHILWGPPGTGKTTIARLLATTGGHVFLSLSAIFSGVADLKKAFAQARDYARQGRSTLLFVDEIHRFNRAQQDGFLPFVEDGTIILVGATTENPSFELNAALLSRLHVFVLNRLDDHALNGLLARAEEALETSLPLTGDARQMMIDLADGDGRYLLNMVETLMAAPPRQALDVEALRERLKKRMPVYDKDRDGHYNLISALHKSLRGSDVDAALYYAARMLEAGEDPLYILRRLVRFASEDVGLADPQALAHTIAAREAYQLLGTPEGELALMQAVIYLATAPKSNAAYRAEKAARKSARETGSMMPPKHILNKPTELMKSLGYGEGYQYDHDREVAFSGQDYFPEAMPRAHFYQPTDRGNEQSLKARLARWEALRTERANNAPGPRNEPMFSREKE
ncbi:MAG: replication-associated recombination protein A [Pseudomonadota bacterium]